MKTKSKPGVKGVSDGPRAEAAPAVVTKKEREAPVTEKGPARIRLSRILVPVDFSEPSLKALQYAIRFAEQFGAEITLQHVVEPIVYPSEIGYAAEEIPMLSEQTLVKSAGERLVKLAREAVRPPLRVQTVISIGSPFHEITALAKDRNVDLIIVTTHGYTGLKHVLMGSTAERVVRHAPCPVLTVREHEHEFVDAPSARG